MSNRTVSALLAALLLALLAVTPAQAFDKPDSHAPKGARGDWLPMNSWVMSGWLPYDESRMCRLLQTDREELSVWLNDKRSLGRLARKRGYHDMRRLALRLVMTRDVSTKMRRTLIERALDTLTQPHLARHLLFHLYHASALTRQAKRVFGVTSAGYVRLRGSGYTPIQIGHAGHRSTKELKRTLTAFFRRRNLRGARIGAISMRQAKLHTSQQMAGLDKFMHTHYRTVEEQREFANADHPYGPHGDSLKHP